jgi:hypothetical protein
MILVWRMEASKKLDGQYGEFLVWVLSRVGPGTEYLAQSGETQLSTYFVPFCEC